MTTNTTTTAQAEFKKDMALTNAELIIAIYGSQITAAEPVNNIEYKGKVYCGIALTVQGYASRVCLLPWEIRQSVVLDYSESTAKSLPLTDVLHTTAKQTFAAANGDEQAWYQAICQQIVGKKCSQFTYVDKALKGNTYSKTIFAVE